MFQVSDWWLPSRVALRVEPGGFSAAPKGRAAERSAGGAPGRMRPYRRQGNGAAVTVFFRGRSNCNDPQWSAGVLCRSEMEGVAIASVVTGKAHDRSVVELPGRGKRPARANGKRRGLTIQ